jgi:hypothetical protein
MGGGGADNFAFYPGWGPAGHDRILDFTSGIDTLDLRIHGITASDVDITEVGSDTLIAVDVTEDGSADFTITLVGVLGINATSGDFLFA